MDIPRFCEEHLNRHLMSTDIGDAFQRFAAEVLKCEYANLHSFPADGKDGGIDLVDRGDVLTVFECKHVGAGDLAAVKKRWLKVEDNLDKHLVDPAGPTVGQAQYRPWYRTDHPVRRYVLCVTAILGNQNQHDELRDQIRDFFHGLAGKLPHLAHLGKVEVKIVDWSDFRSLLDAQPHKLFRWFPDTRPSGLIPLDHPVGTSTFRSYLDEGKLPFYSLRRHLQDHPPPEDAEILDEWALLDSLNARDVSGLVVHGQGGVGKTRLCLELGRLALQQGWTVLRVAERFKLDALDRLAERLAPDTPVLLVVDYVETQTDFTGLVEAINLLNDTWSLQIRYVASCRTGYHSRIRLLGRYRPVNVSPPQGDPVGEWLDTYRRETVRHILDTCGIQPGPDHLRACHQRPVLAVFIAYLHATGRHDDLAELLREESFERWVTKRVQLSFQTDVHAELARLAAMFPMPDDAARQLKAEPYERLFERLAADGWVERDEAEDTGTRWVAVHDVLVDQIVLCYLTDHSPTAEIFVDRLLAHAAEIGCLDSAVYALQRLVGQPPLNALGWPDILSRQMAAEPAAWRRVRGITIRTSLLTPAEIVTLLERHPEIWEGAERDIGFQNALGYFARHVVRGADDLLNESQRETLVSWIAKAAAVVQTSNFVLTWGLRLAPDAIRGFALDWILTRPALFQTHYLMVAWLESGLPIDETRESVQQWCRQFPRDSRLSFIVRAWLRADGELDLVRSSIQAWLAGHETDPEAQFVYTSWLNAQGERDLVQSSIQAWLAEHATDAQANFVYKSWLDAQGELKLVHSPIQAWLAEHATDAEAPFVYKAWLDAQGERDLVRKPIQAWLAEHATDAEAPFVYKAWLDAKGERDLVRKPIQAWLAKHATDADAEFVYKSWLEAGGDFQVVREPALAWLHQNTENVDAVYVTKFIAKQRELPAEAVSDILTWCRTFPRNEDAIWRLTQLNRHLQRPEVAEDICNASEAVLDPILSSRSPLRSVTRGQVTTLLLHLLILTRSGPPTLQNRVDGLLAAWMRHPCSFGRDLRVQTWVQHTLYFARVVYLIETREIDTDRDRPALERFLGWVDAWDADRKPAIRQMLDDLKREYPVTGLWESVRFD